jgi:hypothetical protein
MQVVTFGEDEELSGKTHLVCVAVKITAATVSSTVAETQIVLPSLPPNYAPNSVNADVGITYTIADHYHGSCARAGMDASARDDSASK